ncbi:hypothetical protein GJ697_11095 [Pseudoduganella sp. FT25W]|jgi:hypothetical protein|uniref:Uncharacterized protein n=1 Tax=Duganella alba TaxID=2666081 RepID=A0A6L5QF53_9BURK|nr:hypothetical protein [Duganella alba]MRX08383.1 hypothetical protein [Duganella alba]MRX16922.1 hypothetical protein [Duganella alba]
MDTVDLPWESIAQRILVDFIFELNQAELDILRSQFATSSWGGKPRSFQRGMKVLLNSLPR